ncbi:MAG: hypothetical protein RL637_579 [Pseudomonadota bacterium]|jgi:tRNA (mo5U34)-methyltransferase
MINYTALYSLLIAEKAQTWAELLPQQINQALSPQQHGSLSEWFAMLQQLPKLTTNVRELNHSVTIGCDTDLSFIEKNYLIQLLKSLKPWRKGPFNLFGIHIDSEWRSDWKWQRVISAIKPLKGRLVLDIGCGNGYYAWRMLGAGAKAVIGIDPTLLNLIQFQAIYQLYGQFAPIHILPLGIEQLPSEIGIFDSVFSMGVLYHRRSPIDHLLELRSLLRPGGELILETLVIEGDLGQILVPENRYAQMRNVWFLPSSQTLISWLKRCGFINIRLVDQSKTTIAEQRATEWMDFQSLDSFLDPNNSDLTCEGLPAPQRAIFIAEIP